MILLTRHCYRPQATVWLHKLSDLKSQVMVILEMTSDGSVMIRVLEVAPLNMAASTGQQMASNVLVAVEKVKAPIRSASGVIGGTKTQ